ncbi:flagellar protein [Paenibacillus sp. YYML68]|uniref:flagellar protein n=1 Tax=Paenibacillus sp. YYML68 TaxID=2909250 RepID=UPI0024935FA6|nr:flagellar protein [Paenibacillus sp. YYML68]
MSMLKVANCPKCGKVFQKNMRNLCQPCQQACDNQYEQCHAYLLRHRTASTEEVSEAVNVPAAVIHGLIKENKLPVSYFAGLTFPCESCGSPIRQHKLCACCKSRLDSDIRELKEREAKDRERGSGFHVREGTRR